MAAGSKTPSPEPGHRGQRVASQPATPGRAWTPHHVPPELTNLVLAPITPPRRNSSLGFSNRMQSSSKPKHCSMNRVAQGPAASQTPSRPVSNIGAKRLWSSPLARSVASPGHSSQMQKLFREARATLQLDATILSSPIGSIASRLPDLKEEIHVRPRRECAAVMPTDWRYSIAPLRVAGTEVDVREPLSAPAPLPGSTPTPIDSSHGFVEPISSGFNSPIATREADEKALEGTEVQASNLPPIPSSRDDWSMGSSVPSIVSNGCREALDRGTDLDHPMTQMNINPVQTWLENIVDDSEARSDVATCQSAGVPQSVVEDPDIDMNHWPSPKEIILTTPAKAAAESAKLKRDLLGEGVWASKRQPQRRTRSQEGDSVPLCKTPTSNLLTVPTIQITPSPDFPHGSPPPRALRQNRRPPPNLRRVDSRGSPFPSLKYSPGAQEDLVHGQPLRHLIPNPEQFASPVRGDPSPFRQQPLAVNGRTWPHHANAALAFDESLSSQPFFAPSAYQVPDSQQMIHLQAPPIRAPVRGPQSPWLEKPFYSFSTAAGASAGSSTAPDSVIRDSYRTDTLTPFELPNVRFRKIGLGAALQKGTHQSQGGPFKRRSGQFRAGAGNRTSMGPMRGEPRGGARKFYSSAPYRRQGPRSPQEVVFRSSPPRPAEPIFSTPRRKKPRRMMSPSGVLPSMTEEDEAQQLYIPHRADSRETQESDESSQNQWTTEMSTGKQDTGNERMTVRETIIAQPKQSMHQTPSYRSQSALVQDDGADVDLSGLSPYVTPYRKGRGPKERRPSYWDDDILGKRSGDQDKENRPPSEAVSEVDDVDML